MGVISLEKKEKIIQLSKDGKNQREISKICNVSLYAVFYNLKKHKNNIPLCHAPRTGRPQKLSCRQKRLIVILSKKDPQKTANQLKNEANLNDICSTDTIKRILRQNNLFGRISVKKPLLTKSNIVKRRNWCSKYFIKTCNFWAKVIFSDEVKFQIDTNMRRYVRRPINKRFLKKYVRPTVKYSSSIMVWGCIFSDGSKKIIKCIRNVNSLEYQRILNSVDILKDDNDYILQQDNAPCHKSLSTMEFLERKNINILNNWPPQSPDLNIIENLWPILKTNVSKRKATNREQLWTFIQEEWEKIPTSTITKLYQSIPKRIRSVLAANGQHSKY